MFFLSWLYVNEILLPLKRIEWVYAVFINIIAHISNKYKINQCSILEKTQQIDFVDGQVLWE